MTTTTTEELKAKLANAQRHKVKAEADRDAATRAEDYLREHASGLGYGGSNAHRGANKIHAQSRANAARWKEADDRAKHWAQKIRGYEQRIAERERVRLTRADILGATRIRTRYGWHTVVRVNKTTVSCKSGYSWVDRYTFDKVLEVHKP